MPRWETHSIRGFSKPFGENRGKVPSLAERLTFEHWKKWRRKNRRKGVIEWWWCMDDVTGDLEDTRVFFGVNINHIHATQFLGWKNPTIFGTTTQLCLQIQKHLLQSLHLHFKVDPSKICWLEIRTWQVECSWWPWHFGLWSLQSESVFFALLQIPCS